MSLLAKSFGLDETEQPIPNIAEMLKGLANDVVNAD